MIKMWAHECYRVFSDRLINKADRIVFKDILEGTIKNNFKISKPIQTEKLVFSDYVPV